MVGPVAQFDDLLRRHTLGRERSLHRFADRGYDVGGGKRALFEPLRGVGHAALAEQACRLRRADLEILDVEPVGHTRTARHPRRNRRCNQRWRESHDQIGAQFAPRQPGGGIGAAGKAEVMRQPPRSGRIGRDVMRAARDGDAVLGRDLPPPAEEFMHLPFGVIGMTDHCVDHMAPLYQRFHQSCAIGPDADRLGRIVQADEKDSATSRVPAHAGRRPLTPEAPPSAAERPAKSVSMMAASLSSVSRSSTVCSRSGMV